MHFYFFNYFENVEMQFLNQQKASFVCVCFNF